MKEIDLLNVLNVIPHMEIITKMYIKLMRSLNSLVIILCMLFLLYLHYCWDKIFLETKTTMMEVKMALNKPTEPVIQFKGDVKPKMVFAGNDLRYEQTLERVLAVIELIGYQYARWDNSTPLDFDFLWCDGCEIPYKDLTRDYLVKLKKHQIVNTLTGSGCVTNKWNFVHMNSSGILPTFFLPKDEETLKLFAQRNPNKMFLSKGSDHRNINLQNVTTLIQERKLNTFVQEFMSNPLLIDGYKFEFGVYAYITTLKPLRIYIYDDIQIRLCNKKYLPFNASDEDTYIIKGANYFPVWKVDSFKEIYRLGYSKKAILNWYLETTYGKKVVSNMWKSVKNIITDVYLECQEGMFRDQSWYAPSPSSRNYQEHVRFDFTMDESFNVFVMEANFAPNLNAHKVPENTNMFDQVIFNTLHIRGVTSRLMVNHIYDAVVANKDIFTTPMKCFSCNYDCSSASCRLCPLCLNLREKLVLKEAWLENSRKHMTKRVFPTETTSKHRKLIPIDQIQADWFSRKCLEDSSWCE